MRFSLTRGALLAATAPRARAAFSQNIFGPGTQSVNAGCSCGVVGTDSVAFVGTTSGGVTISGGQQRNISGPSDAFILIYSSTGLPTLFTLIGGSGADTGTAIACSNSGLFIAGFTSSPTFYQLTVTSPTPRAFFVRVNVLTGLPHWVAVDALSPPVDFVADLFATASQLVISAAFNDGGTRRVGYFRLFANSGLYFELPNIFVSPASDFASCSVFDERAGALMLGVATTNNYAFFGAPARGDLDAVVFLYQSMGSSVTSMVQVASTGLDAFADMAIEFDYASGGGSAIYAVGITDGVLPTGPVGGFNVNAGDRDCFLAYLLRQSLQWVVQFGGPLRDSCRSVAIDSTQDFVYTAGATRGSWGGQLANLGADDAFLAKWTRSGTRLWLRFFPSSNTGASEVVSAMLTTSLGYVFFALNVVGNSPIPSLEVIAAADDAAVVSWSCPPGSVNSNGGTSVLCESCPVARSWTSPEVGAINTSECVVCSPGRFRSVSTCAPCPRGSFSVLPNSSTCELCQPGRFTATQLSVVCASCPPDYFASQAGATTCQQCSRIGSNGLQCSGAGQCSPLSGTCVCSEGFRGDLCNDPSISAVSSERGVLSEPGQVLTISGVFFGVIPGVVAIRPNITASGSICIIMSWADVRIRCNVSVSLLLHCVGNPPTFLVSVTTSEARTHFFPVQVESPRIFSVAPLVGSAVGGTTVSITGLSLFASQTTELIISSQPTPWIGFSFTSPQGSGTSVLYFGTPPGFAANASMMLRFVSGSIVQLVPLNVTFSYERPVITGVTPSNGPAVGGVVVTVLGRNFFNISSVFFGAQQCTQPSRLNGTHITCISPALSTLSVLIGVTYRSGSVDLATSSSIARFNADPPRIINISGCAGVNRSGSAIQLINCSVLGTSVMTVEGENLGSGAGLLPDIRIGSERCGEVIYLVNHFRLNCTIPPGFGVRNVSVYPSSSTYTPSGPSDFSVMYASGALNPNSLVLVGSPEVTTGRGPGSVILPSTFGNYTLAIRGVFAFAGAVNSDGALAIVDVLLGSPSVLASSQSTGFISAVALLNESNITTLLFEVRGGVGRNLAIDIRVDAVSLIGPSGFTGDLLTNSVSFPPPLLTNGSLRLSTQGVSEGAALLVSVTTVGERIALSGSSLGSQAFPPTVLYLPVGANFSDVTLHDECYDVFINQTTLLCTMKPLRLAYNDYVFYVLVGQAESRQITVSFDVYRYATPPQVFSVRGCEDNLQSNATLNCPTDALRNGAPVRLTIEGSDFVPQLTRVQLGSLSCTNVTVWSSTNLTCMLPEGAGAQVGVVVGVADVRFSLSRPLLSYAAPVIHNVTGCAATPAGNRDCRRMGGERITITGEYFGGSGAVALVGGEVCNDLRHEPASPHRLLTCGLRPGVGLNRAVAVLQAAGQLSSNFGDLSYEPCAAGQFLQTGTTNCLDCPAGSFSAVEGLREECVACARGFFGRIGGLVACDPCPLGTFASTAGRSTCEPCRPGTTASSVAQTDCRPCVPGEFSALNASTCERCAAGRFRLLPEGTMCSDCEPGTFSGEGAAQCRPCEAGTFASEGGASICTPCQQGRFGNSSGLTACVPCQPGSAASGRGAVLCTLCGPGTFAAAAGSPTCAQCDPGTAQPVAGASSCAQCEPGTYSDAPGLRDCRPCVAGQEQPLLGQQACGSCPAGRSAPTPRTAQCVPCSEGFVSSALNPTECEPCPAGRFQNETGQSLCHECAPGRYAESTRATRCTDCESGRFGLGSALSTCVECPAGSFQNATGSQACEACPFGKATPQTRSSTCLLCSPGTFTQRPTGSIECVACGPGLYLSVPVGADGTPGNAPSCLPCPENTNCNEGTAAADQGYWIDRLPSGELRVYSCPSGFCMEGGLCGPGRRGNASDNPLCGECEEGFYLWGRECQRCDEGARADIILPVCLVLIVVVLVVHRLAQSPAGEMKVCLYFVQMALLLLGSERRSSFFVLEVFNLDLFRAGGASVCIAPVSQRDRLMLGLLPQAYSLAVLGIFTLLSFAKSRLAPSDIFERWRWQPFARTAVALYLLTYNAVTAAVFDYLACVEISFRGEPMRLVYAAPAVNCDSPEYRQLLPLVWVVLLVEVVFVPLGLGLALAVARRRGLLTEGARPPPRPSSSLDAVAEGSGARRHAVRADPDAEGDGEAGGMEASKRSGVLGILYVVYRRTAFFWELVAIFRRLMLVSVVVFLASRHGTKFALASLFCMSHLLLHVYMRPYRSNVLNVVETVTLALLASLAAVLGAVGRTSSAGTDAAIALLVYLPSALLILWLLVSRVTALYMLVLRVRAYFSRWSASDAAALQSVVLPRVPDRLGSAASMSMDSVPDASASAAGAAPSVTSAGSFAALPSERDTFTATPHGASPGEGEVELVPLSEAKTEDDLRMR